MPCQHVNTNICDSMVISQGTEILKFTLQPMFWFKIFLPHTRNLTPFIGSLLQNAMFFLCFFVLFSSRSAAVGQTCGQLWCPVLIYHQWGNRVHLPLQLRCSPIPYHQHWSPETRQESLDYPHLAARQGCSGWDWMEILIRQQVKVQVSFVVHLCSFSSLKKKCDTSKGLDDSSTDLWTADLWKLWAKS